MAQRARKRRRATKFSKRGRPRSKGALENLELLQRRFFEATQDKRGCPVVLNTLRNRCLPAFRHLADRDNEGNRRGIFFTDFFWDSYNREQPLDKRRSALKDALEAWARRFHLIDYEWILGKALEILNHWEGNKEATDHLCLPWQALDKYMADLMTLPPFFTFSIDSDSANPSKDRTFEGYRERVWSDVLRRVESALCLHWKASLSEYSLKRRVLRAEERGIPAVDTAGRGVSFMGRYRDVPARDDVVWAALARNVCLRESFEKLGPRLKRSESSLRKAVSPLANALGLRTTLHGKQSGR